MTNSQYHARAEISKSDLDLLARSPKLLKLKKDGLLQSEQTPSLLLGSVTHKLVLEPFSFDSEYAVAPLCDKRTKEGKEIIAEFERKSEGKTIITAEIYEKAKAMSEAVLSHGATNTFLSHGHAEGAYFGEMDGVAVKCKPDFYNPKLGLIIDLKTTDDASPAGFAKSIANYNYHVQCAFYSDILRNLGEKVSKFLFIAVEKKEPYEVAFYELDTEAIEKGRERYKSLLSLWRHCVDKGEFFGYGEFDGENYKPVRTLSLPVWKLNEF